MKITYLFIIILIIVPGVLFSQQQREPGSHLPKPTAKGVGKIDTRIDNMRYWRRMADSGFVYLAPVESVPSAVYTGSRIESPMVMTTNSPDVPTTAIGNTTQTEISVFVNPMNKLSILNSNNSTDAPNPDVDTLYGADYLTSTNGGITWGGTINGAGGFNSGDPATAIGLTGRQYIDFIDVNSGQSVAYSTDNGNTWTSVVAATQNGSLLDKNHMWIDNSPVSPYEGNLYVAYTDFGASGYPIEITRSINDGLTYSTPIPISSSVNAGSHNQGVNVQTGPGGEVYVAWAIYDSWPSDETSIGFTKSTNGGSSFANATRIISNIHGIRTSETSKDHRVNSFPSMAVDISGGPNNGNIYIVWTNIGIPGVNAGSDIDVYMIRSTNGGTSWSTPIRVNQDPTGLGNEHYFPWITCDPITGELSVIFYDDRNVSSTQCEVFVAYSYSAGDLWEDFKVSDVAFTPAAIPGLAGGYMGDYLGNSSVEGSVYPTWTDNRSGTNKTYVSPFTLTPLPNSYFTAGITTPCLDQTIFFQDMSLKNPTAWLWSISPAGYSFVNSTSPTSQNPQIQFNIYGNYSIQLIATNSDGSDTLIRTNYISVSNVSADFSVNITNVNVGNAVTFTDQSICGITSYLWNFGSGASPATATTAGPHVVTYSTPGFKDITLTVNGDVTEFKNNYIMVDAAYCAASATCDEYISNVTIGSINNSSACTSGGYKKYTQYWTKVSPGIAYPISIANGLFYTGDQCRIWVDWNQDLDFSDAGETISVTAISGGISFTGTITPPTNAVKGLTRMRIRITYTGLVNACGTLTYGETEDYSLYVGTPGLWEGGTAGAESDWNTPNNWDDGRVPEASVNVVIPASVNDFPGISGSFSCLDMVIKDGATVTFEPGSVLNILGDLEVGEGSSGILIINGGTCNLTGQTTASPGSTIDLINGGVMYDND